MSRQGPRLTATGARRAEFRMEGEDFPERLSGGWTPSRVGRRILWLPETTSTNAVALEAAIQEDADGLAVLADYQSAGRGRLGREWLSPRGASVLCSVVLVWPDAVVSRISGRLRAHAPAVVREEKAALVGVESGGPSVLGWALNMTAAVAACEAIGGATELRPSIKWPNDLLMDGKKLGGILIETRGLPEARRAYVVGFGINCLQHRGHFPPELRDGATSLELAASHAVDRVAVARELLIRFDARTSGDGWADDPAVHAQWVSFAEPIGRRITLRQHSLEYSGRTVAVDPLGGLTVQLDNGRQMWFDPLLTSVT